MFLFVIGHNERHRVVADRFQQSTSTTSEYFRKLLKAVCRLSKELITPPLFDVVLLEIQYPFFKNCVGAIDGTHISAHVPIDEQIPYRGQKVDTTQNVMCICSFDMKFTYVVAGWEGLANDARILSECATNPGYEFPAPPNDRNPPGKRELFNYRHSSLRNVIERCFSKKTYIDGDEDIPEVQDATIQSTHEILNDSVEFSISRDQIREMANVRDKIADHIQRAN
ncbi:protein ALP1-like [Cannabis sativa]|uniref:protein ALP1-like n=1 Tax=Cannabis sativa TaxID=3483 RepID=UPI0029C9BF50|nr:protein ALP1-like [Cannabis sativa]